MGFYGSFGFIQISMQNDDTKQTAFMVYDLLKPSEFENDVLFMIEFCEEYELGNLTVLLKNN